MTVQKLQNFINGKWVDSPSGGYRDVINPATAEVIAQSPLSPVSELDRAAKVATKAFESWKKVPAVQRVQYLFKL
jgi:malonate-semialdehyde dehydrogenase (acetylating)/methylmalonate-semialdehyde dehydrogenase